MIISFIKYINIFLKKLIYLTYLFKKIDKNKITPFSLKNGTSDNKK